MYAIVWSDEAFDAMQRIVLLHSGRRGEIAAALRGAADQLYRDPLNAGESRTAVHDRVLIADPLTVCFLVDVPTTTVEVARILFTG